MITTQAAGGRSEGPFIQFARTLERRHTRRELAQAALDAMRWVAALYAASLLAVAACDAELAVPARLPLASAGAVAWAGLAAVLYRRRLASSGGVVGRLEAALGSQQLATTAWEWVHGRIRSPFGPAIVEAADRLAMAAWARLPSLVRPVACRRRTLVAVIVAAGLSVPGALVSLERAAREVRTRLAPPAAPEGALPALSPEEAEFLQRLARLLERDALATGDPQAERAARELQSVLSMNAAGAQATGRALPIGPALPGRSPASGPLPDDLASRSLWGGGPSSPSAASLESRLALLMRLAQLNLITRETADRSAELAALLTDALLLEEGEPAPGSDLRGTAGAEQEPSPAGAGGSSPPRNAGVEASSGPQNPPGSDLLDEGLRGGELPAELTRRLESRDFPGQDARPDAAASADRGQPELQGSAGHGTGAREEQAGASGRLQGVPAASGPPGTSPGVLEAGGEAALEEAGERVPLPSGPQIGRGAVLTVLPGPSVRPEPGHHPEAPWRADSAVTQPDIQGPPASLESVPLEYREAVRRYFEALAGEGK